MAPFQESAEDGSPLWRLQVEDPAHAASSARQLAWRVLNYPEGPLLALVLRVHDGQGKPLLFHHALLMNSPAFASLHRAGKATLAFERHGFMSDARIPLPIDLGPLQPASQGSAAALERYVGAYRQGVAASGSPEGAWDAIERGLAQPAAKAATGSGAKWALALAAAAAAALAWYFLK